MLLDSQTTGNTFSNVSFDYHLSNVNNEEYTCESYLSATDGNPFIKNSNITSSTTTVTGLSIIANVLLYILYRGLSCTSCGWFHVLWYYSDSNNWCCCIDYLVSHHYKMTMRFMII